MSALQGFRPPGDLAELSPEGRAGWDALVHGIVARFARLFPQFYDPTAPGSDDGLIDPIVRWPAFPARVGREEPTAEARWRRADATREVQAEYCEWSVERDAQQRIERVVFTTETPDYYRHLLVADPELLRDLYEQFTGQRPELDELLDADGLYVERNRWNRATSGPIVHLQQDSNTLGAAVRLAAEATILRESAPGVPVTDREDLVACGGLGDPLRNSDPTIASAVNGLAADGLEITLADPPGLYVDGLATAPIAAPDGADASEFWEVTRGEQRGTFAVPAERGYTVSDLTIGGVPIAFGAQLADLVSVRIAVLARPGGHRPVPKPCEP